MLINNSQSNPVRFVLTHSIRSSGQYGDAKILFNRYSEKYFLSQVFYGLGEGSRELPVSRLEGDSIGAHSATNHSRKPEVVVVGTTY